MKNYITVIGGGLAGSEAAYQIAKRGIKVKLYEMKPIKFTEAHSNKNLAEIVCSNSFKSNLHTNACGLLKEELRYLDSLLIKIADETQVPAGQALAVDRELFAKRVTDEIEKNPLIEIIHEEVTNLDELVKDAHSNVTLFEPFLKIEKIIENLIGIKKAVNDLEKNVPKSLCERYEKLENIRKKFIKKQIFLSAFTILMALVLTVIIDLFLKDFLEISIIISVVIIILLVSFVIGVDEEFERLVKRIHISKYDEESQILNFITGKRAKIKWDSRYFEYDKEKLQKRYNVETGLDYINLSPELQFKYENKHLISDSERIFGTSFFSDDNFQCICDGVKFS